MAESDRPVAHWIETGVPELDRVLGGGLLQGSLAMVIGSPGAGKTVMAQQIAFHYAARGHATLFLTGFSEPHDKLLSHSRSLTFFREELVGDKIQFASLLGLLREGATETENAIVDTARAQSASLVIIDGFRGIRRLLRDDQAVASFLYSLGAKLAMTGATTLLCLEGDPDEAGRYPEITVCDVILALRRELRDSRERKLLQVVKARGSSPLHGLHLYTITGDGISVFPRFESTVSASSSAWTPGRAAFGIDQFDAMLQGGLNRSTVTLAAGSPGVGKTLLGLHVVAAGARDGEPALFLGFMESEAQLREQARVFGLDLRAGGAAALTRLLVLPGHDLEADHVAKLLVEDVERRGVRRLVIDSAAELERGVGMPERKPGFLSALVSYLRDRQVTTYATLDIPTLAGPTLELGNTPLSVVAENLLLLRSVEYRGALHRVFSVLKMRFSDHERAIYEYVIDPGEGIRITGPAPLGEGLLTGIARPLVDIPLQTQSDGG